MKAVLLRSLWGLLGRRKLVRLARFLTNEARLDVNNRMDRNGEQMVQRVVAEHARAGEPLVAFDVGANLGEWSRSLALAAAGRPLHLYAFEPCEETYRRLLAVGAECAAGQRFTAVRAAVSRREGAATLHVVADGSGVNSLHANERRPAQRAERVPLHSLDSYCRREGIGRIDLLKIDTEGHDLAVLEGCEALLAEHRVEVAQFEYNHAWVFSRTFLRDVFELAARHDYRLGKVTPLGIEFYPRWDPELERFQEGNYLLCRKPWMDRFPCVGWWKDTPAVPFSPRAA